MWPYLESSFQRGDVSSHGVVREGPNPFWLGCLWEAEVWAHRHSRMPTQREEWRGGKAGSPPQARESAWSQPADTLNTDSWPPGCAKAPFCCLSRPIRNLSGQPQQADTASDSASVTVMGTVLAAHPCSLASQPQVEHLSCVFTFHSPVLYSIRERSWELINSIILRSY